MHGNIFFIKVRITHRDFWKLSSCSQGRFVLVETTIARALSILTGFVFTVPFNNMGTCVFFIFYFINLHLFFNNQKQMRFSVPPMKCSAAPPSLPLLPRAWLSNQIKHNTVGSWKAQPNISLAVAKNAFASWALNFRVRMSLEGVVTMFLENALELNRRVT